MRTKVLIILGLSLLLVGCGKKESDEFFVENTGQPIIREDEVESLQDTVIEDNLDVSTAPNIESKEQVEPSAISDMSVSDTDTSVDNSAEKSQVVAVIEQSDDEQDENLDIIIHTEDTIKDQNDLYNDILVNAKTPETNYKIVTDFCGVTTSYVFLDENNFYQQVKLSDELVKDLMIYNYIEDIDNKSTSLYYDVACIDGTYYGCVNNLGNLVSGKLTNVDDELLIDFNKFTIQNIKDVKDNGNLLKVDCDLMTPSGVVYNGTVEMTKDYEITKYIVKDFSSVANVSMEYAVTSATKLPVSNSYYGKQTLDKMEFFEAYTDLVILLQEIQSKTR